MGNRHFAASLSVAVLTSLPLLAASFWDKKPYQEWSDQEIARILIVSHWACPW